MRQMIYKRFERFWHWSQSLLMLAMLVTGFEIHGTFSWLGFEQALLWHEVGALALIILWLFAIFWHFTTGEWRQYIPTTEKLMTVIRYYSKDIFFGKPHPYKATPERKHNPLQRFSYLGFKLLLAPVIWLSGLLLLAYPFGLEVFSLATLSAVHLVAAFLILIFLIVHVYMTTTGPTPLSHIKTMFTGYEEPQEQGNKEPTQSTKKTV
ncbi:cytochrome b/b6 domain-containing protein [Photobacterium rosenbergii]|uniref:Cytochrome b/b6 domain-containing protein n=1 Tax=Photobacterium rosenbergii TaxID=294936 RepID=A0ABU3ZHL1_9GAMM|nr:cytochrome b/b6 domain-containing protein [Photobacterium rosenbergii]MDV5169527.1 cytochrome b/b6 domain-containing protein [Photobacterium rosenbergii]